MLRGSQVCSALRRLWRLGLAFGHPFTALGQGAFGPLASSWREQLQLKEDKSKALLFMRRPSEAQPSWAVVWPWPSDAQQCREAADRGRRPKGRANSELRSVAPARLGQRPSWAGGPK
ncbi:hypothetical protein SGRA_2311 [Saprospira grandis str. Lewin]|uniref:Uncharacterized protein n=1 Tax=Saprospira grandis (strain Lewin) TaxID=984262 RepID=H6L456_SAPGL|nr:hypothetical protein SGRA_2311 [Saprospira grandis str. Lewin]